jgi:hypothetical protein
VDQLLTPGLRMLLFKNPALFLEVIRTTSLYESPTIIWDVDMKTKLIEELKMQLKTIEKSRDASWDLAMFLAADSFLYTYPILEKEINVMGVYLRCFNANPQAFDHVPMIDMCNELLSRLNKVDFSVSLPEDKKKLTAYISAIFAAIKLDKSLGDKIQGKNKVMLVDLSVNPLLDSGNRKLLIQVLLKLIEITSLDFTLESMHRLYKLLVNYKLDTEDTFFYLTIIYMLLGQSLDVVVARSPIVVYLAYVLLTPAYEAKSRWKAAQGFATLVTCSKTHGEKILKWFSGIMNPLFSSPTTYRDVLLAGCANPDALITRVDTVEESCTLIWNAQVMKDVSVYLRSEVDKFRDMGEGELGDAIDKASEGKYAVDLTDYFCCDALANEIVVQKIYLKFLLENSAKISTVDSVALLEGLIKILASHSNDKEVTEETSNRIQVLWRVVSVLLSPPLFAYLFPT